jgi:phosphoribosylglycinamide formyltransferase-1
MTFLNLGFLASHGGSNMQAIVDACKDGRLNAIPRVVISNNPDSPALQRAEKEGIPRYHLSSITHPAPDALDGRIKGVLQEHAVDVVVLAGYMKKIGPQTLDAFRGRILNIHPALLPKYGGKGMYGKRVHEAVLASGDKVTGVTVHVIDEEYDTGPIIAQSKVRVEKGDTVDSLAERVLNREHEFFVETLGRIASGDLQLPAR